MTGHCTIDGTRFDLAEIEEVYHRGPISGPQDLTVKGLVLVLFRDGRVFVREDVTIKIEPDTVVNEVRGDRSYVRITSMAESGMNLGVHHE